jgi:hypothetical protein
VNATPFELLERCPHMLRRFFDQFEHHHRISEPERVIVDPLDAGAAERSDEVIDELVQARPLNSMRDPLSSSPARMSDTRPAREKTRSSTVR